MRSLKLHSSYFLRAENFYWILAAQAACILPLFFKLPYWVAAVWLLAFVWRIQIQRQRWPYPNNFIKLILGGSCVALTLISFPSVLGLEPMIGFLVCSYVLKLIEMRSSKDAIIILFIGFIAVAAQFLLAQSILTAVIALLALIILLSAWRSALSLRKQGLLKNALSGAELLAQSLPFMLVLFVFLPRLGPLWTVPLPSDRGTTGFSDSLTMGDVGQLVQSREVAFRAEFEQQLPEASELYWRGLVLDNFDGNSWFPGGNFDQRLKQGPLKKNKPRGAFTYSVLMEPHYQRWLFTLGIPLNVNSPHNKAYIVDGYLLHTRRPVTQKIQYQLESQSYQKYSFPALDAQQKQQLTYLPANSNPQARDLAQSWRLQGLNTVQMMLKARQLMSSGFIYTLQPGKSGKQAIDEFLFSSKAGFCEHFASSFVFLMRASGVPARVVVGYQGGRFNADDGYFVIRQSDAHAWAEVWVEDAWQRVDPTAWIAPQRIEQGVEQVLSSADLALMENTIWQKSWLRGLHQSWDALGYSWNKWVLNYSNDKQQGLLKRILGQYSILRVALAFVGLCIAIFLSLYWWPKILRWLLNPNPPETRLILYVLKRLRRLGYERQKHETLRQFADRVGDVNPALKQPLLNFLLNYERHVYAGAANISIQQLMQDANAVLRVKRSQKI